MFDEICDEAHDAHTMRTINRTVMSIVACFLVFGGYAIATRLGADAPPTSVTYGSQQAEKGAAVFGD